MDKDFGRTYWVDLDGTQEPIEEDMIAKLLDENVLFCNGRKYLDHGKENPETVVLFINCNDVFCCGSDAEELAYNEIAKLFSLYMEKGDNGTIEFVSFKRGKQPRLRFKRFMIEEGFWNPDLERLTENLD